jgi:hypothetical protein
LQQPRQHDDERPPSPIADKVGAKASMAIATVINATTASMPALRPCLSV